jgi:D-glycero-D-manno-heptose 1,7-bisphosphate phosphatase
LEEVETLPGTEQACRDLRTAGFLLIMVTNQPDVARGSQTKEVVEALNRLVADRLRLDVVKVCYHDNADNCNCRKPEPGLLREAAQELNIDLSGSFMIGDRSKDIEAGRRAGCKTILMQSGYAERKPEGVDVEVRCLTAAVDWILQKTCSPEGEPA